MTKKDKLEKDAKAMRLRLQKRKVKEKTATKTRKEGRKLAKKEKKKLLSTSSLSETPSLPVPKKKQPLLTAHKKGFSKKCEVCQHDKVAIIEELYLDWRPIKWIADTFGVQVTKLMNHVRSAKLDQKRADNTKGAYRIFVEKGIEALEDNEVDPNMAAKLALASAQHIDKLEGRIIERRKVDEQKTLRIEAFPMPGPVVEIEAQDVLQLKEENVGE